MNKQQKHAYFEKISTIETRTKDALATLTANIVITYDPDDKNIALELADRRSEIHDFVSRYFAGKNTEELTREMNKKIRNDIREQLNTNFLENTRIKEIVFNGFKVKKR